MFEAGFDQNECCGKYILYKASDSLKAYMRLTRYYGTTRYEICIQTKGHAKLYVSTE